ncbi:MAG: hypothetical protein C4527_00935 [Candidatus Omnitrophota bacterium]|jgi:hypothetical protein|nr:MAG: hypothetical protein C4527_00935 [Candidatus Omnitrophota bacterium]
MTRSFFLASNTFSAESGIAPTQDWSALILPAVVLIIVIIIIFIANLFLRAYFKSQRYAGEWDELEKLFRKFEFSPEEMALLRSKLRKLGYTTPAIVLKSEVEYDKFVKNVLHRPNHHAEFLLVMMRKKIFEQKRNAPKNNPSPKPAVSKAG